MDHPFEVGKEYENRNGRYEVLAINEPKMLIRYENGSEANLTIEIQTRIWRALQDEAQHQSKQAAKKKTRKKRRKTSSRLGSAAAALISSDFKSNIAGTSWRRRKGFGGLLAQQLSDTSPYQFLSYGIYRKPTVYVYIPDHYDPQDGISYAKLDFTLSENGAQYGFYVERADLSRSLGSTWHWHPFVKALESDEKLQSHLTEIMHTHNLQWKLYLEGGEGKNYNIVETIEVRSGNPLIWGKDENITWPEFLNRLQTIPRDRWLNIHLCARTYKEQALQLEIGFANQVTLIYQKILPLYLAAIGIKR